MVTLKTVPTCDYMVAMHLPDNTESGLVERCDDLATHRVYWPKKGERDLCDKHAKIIVGITQKMGIDAKVVSISGPIIGRPIK